MGARRTRWIRPTLIRPTPKGRGTKSWMNPPLDLTKLTAEQVEGCVEYHAAMPLREIRRWQDLVIVAPKGQR